MRSASRSPPAPAAATASTASRVATSPPTEPVRTAGRSKPLRGFSLSTDLALSSLRSEIHARSVGQGRLVRPGSRRLRAPLASPGDVQKPEAHAPLALSGRGCVSVEVRAAFFIQEFLLPARTECERTRSRAGLRARRRKGGALFVDAVDELDEAAVTVAVEVEDQAGKPLQRRLVPLLRLLLRQRRALEDLSVAEDVAEFF